MPLTSVVPVEVASLRPKTGRYGATSLTSRRVPRLIHTQRPRQIATECCDDRLQNDCEQAPAHVGANRVCHHKR